ncbi:MAG: hypothetical protein UV57_C0003G0007 [Parcubacteria group bacterium GW2011_GWD2_43_10]|uniref:Nudix hydrolase domain-containing protein n=4 Tax=Candidatus Vebleniibacteriota TaxID=1817921 RepID=A0A1G2Q673_9BACT|nr:MAG: hypothetical protein UV47_C0012G0025 [Parcubacteria group bacterium GW2011_GWA2_42_80]KKS79411.1 MAG: hypothetical protein UV52_C0010G0011 [Parcubacteria group bacterium GW2011_GWD1_42_9]KKS83973.1 MAG: hypothetical protein UV57_C0003G0007 [Parcubacteria group bacterium GW2011_GWD2_43_10]KKS94118.1 MAG: hypothetical protein UV69_C0001G0007 [Parcubacteria group bacterium GW2011_GWE2_43_12]KKT14037.1 MAG: hypothetical protein UV92_C0008G0028 [Parcubacteria group bacterium GW2011_GWA1_43_2
MVIKAKIIWGGKEHSIEYHDADSFLELPADKITQAYGVCFVDDKIVIGLRGAKQTWGIIGGTVEPGETPEQTLIREVQEESNMRVLKYLPLGYQIVTRPDGSINYQLRYCCMVQPIGNFVSDPAGSIVEIKLVNPADYKEYFDWGEVGDRIIARALELKLKII